MNTAFEFNELSFNQPPKDVMENDTLLDFKKEVNIVSNKVVCTCNSRHYQLTCNLSMVGPHAWSPKQNRKR